MLFYYNLYSLQNIHLQYLVSGSQVVLQRLLYQTLGQKLGLRQPEYNLNTIKKNKGSINQRNEKRSLNKSDKAQKEPPNKGKKAKKSKTSDSEKGKEDITLTQITKRYNFVGHSDSEEAGSDKEDDEERLLSRRHFLSPLTLVQSLKVRECSYDDSNYNFCPSFVPLLIFSLFSVYVCLSLHEQIYINSE